MSFLRQNFVFDLNLLFPEFNCSLYFLRMMIHLHLSLSDEVGTLFYSKERHMERMVTRLCPCPIISSSPIVQCLLSFYDCPSISGRCVETVFLIFNSDRTLSVINSVRHKFSYDGKFPS
uniref:Uncharacterized protein n=1 Tax=Cacopsylla melanoneura TaxID=428564 RepID=A0A8D9E531_9HEMI